MKLEPGYTWWWCWWYPTVTPRHSGFLIFGNYMQLNLSTAAKTIWTKPERKQVSSSGQNRKTTTTAQPRPIRPNSRAARSWNGSSFRRKTYLMKQFRFVKGSEDSVTKCQFPRIFKLRSESFSQPGVPDKNSRFWTRIVLWTNSPCNRSVSLWHITLETVVWCLYGLKGLIVTTGLFSCWRRARFETLRTWKSL